MNNNYHFSFQHVGLLVVIAILSFGRSAQAQSVDWARNIGGTYPDAGRDIQVDAAGNVYMTGFFQGSVDFDPGSGSQLLNASGLSNAFITKWTSTPSHSWSRSIQSDDANEGHALVVDGSGNVYVTGRFEGTADFDVTGGGMSITSSGGYDIFVMKIAASGSLAWVKTIGGTGTDEGNGIAIDASGNVYVCGYFNGTVDFDPGASTTDLTSNGGMDAFILKLNGSGNFVWAKSFGSTGSDNATAVSIDGNDPVVVGNYWYTVDFDPNAGTTELTSAGNSDIFMVKLTSSGSFDWAKGIGGNQADEAFAVDISSGTIFVGGEFKGVCDFNPSGATSNLDAGAYTDGFVATYTSGGGILLFAKAFGGEGNDGVADVHVDASGNILITGFFQGDADFDPGSGTHELSSNGSADIFFCQLTSSGNFSWAYGVGGFTAEHGEAITSDASGKAIATGFFRGTLDFDPGTPTVNLTSGGFEDVFVVSIGSDGTGIEHLASKVSSIIYPNPAQNLVNIEAGGSLIHSYLIYDASGVLVLSERSMSTRQSIDISGLKAGTYSIQMITDKGVGRQKFVVE